ncbi:MAG: PspC domain-containing protein [Bacteroidetes bacterium]|nr:PspC domain-containing protein [Bacteroidota bacterium]
MEAIRSFIEWQLFGVCTWIGNYLSISTVTIRKYFIYASCLTFGSPVILYLIMAFWMNVRQYILNARRNPFRYL